MPGLSLFLPLFWPLLGLTATPGVPPSLAAPGRPSRRPSVAIVHATVLTMADSIPLRDGTVVIRDGRIVAVGPNTTPIPARARIIDGSGKFVIPGLWDMHVHTAVPGGEPLLALYVANGVTGVRDMGGDLATIHAWRRRIRAGALVGPRIVASGPYLQGGDAALPHFVVTTPSEGRAAVRSLALQGSDFVKIHELVPREAFFAVAHAARARGLPLAGHLAAGVTIEEAADSGQRSVEHLNGLRNHCSAVDSTRLAAAAPIIRETLGECTASDQLGIYRHLRGRPFWITPTLVALEMIAAATGETLPSDTLAHYLPAFLLQAMAAALEIPDLPPNSNVLGRALWNKRLDVVQALAREGIPVLAGTDAPLPNSIPGFGLHEELAALVRAGLSPWEALRTATAEPARFFATDSIGVIRPGAVADLVVLDANPLVDIGNTRQIALVIADGRLYSADERTRMKVRAHDIASKGVRPAR